MRPMTSLTGPAPLTELDFAGVIFDMDGTLIDSMAAVDRSWARWAAEYRLTAERLENPAALHGRPAREIVDMFIEPARRDEALARIEQLEVEDTDGIVPLPGAIDALTTIPVVAIATSCTGDLAGARIAAAGLPAPEVVVTASDVTHGKPHPEPYALAARRLGIDPSDALVVEDATSGLRSGRAAGAKTLAVSTTTPREALAELADLVVADLSEIAWTVSGTRVGLSVR